MCQRTWVASAKGPAELAAGARGARLPASSEGAPEQRVFI